MVDYDLKSKKSRFNRMCIAEAIVSLMETKDFDKIKISSVVKKAGISRTTFYKHYNSLDDALYDYMREIVAGYAIESRKYSKVRSLYEYDNIKFALIYFDQYASFFKAMSSHGFHSFLIETINSFLVKYFHSEKYSLFELYCYSGGLLNTFIKWQESGKEKPVEEIAQVIYDVYHHLNTKK